MRLFIRLLGTKRPLAKFQQKQGNDVYIVTPTKDYLYPVYHEFGDYGEHLKEQDEAYEHATGVKIIRIPAKGYFMKRLVYGNDILESLIRLSRMYCLSIVLRPLQQCALFLKNVTIQ